MLAKPNHCKGCLGWGWPDKGYVPSSGDGSNGVLIVAEAAGEHEQYEGMPLVGDQGHYFFQQLQRAGIQREGFMVHNVLSCRPPDNKLRKMPYEDQVIQYCSPLLDNTIGDMQEVCRRNGKTFTILTLGVIAFKRIMGFSEKHPILRKDYLCYPFWSDLYQAWVIPVMHPGYLTRGNHRLVPVLQFGAQRALEIADHGITLDTPEYLLDPEPETFEQWVKDYLRYQENHPDDCYLSYDIETPHKQGQDEEKVAREDDDDYTILRVSFAYQPNRAISIPWRAQYRAQLEELFGSPGPKVGWNSASYDDPRIMAQMPLRGDRLDGMQCWHVLNSNLEKGLGFVTPFYCKTTEVWKYLSDDQPAFYNAKDADMALRNFLGIKKDLIANGQWKVLDRHVVQLGRALNYMSEKGVLRDNEMRAEAETKLQLLLDVVEIKMDAAVPQQARRLHPKDGFKKEPKDTKGLIRAPFCVKVLSCPGCGTEGVTKAHIKAKKKGNPCEGLTLIESMKEVERWAKVLDFKISNKGLQKYQHFLRHQAVLSRKEKKITFDEPALARLIKKYPNDPLYPIIIEHRELQKLLSTYIGVTGPDGVVRGGMPISRDGRIHTLFTHNPSTLRLASQHPNLQNLPRPKGPDDLATIIRNLIIPEPGSILYARDYSGIEAVLVGYFAALADYIRLAKIDVHSFYTAYALNQLDGRISANDLPLLSWDDGKLAARLAEIKREFKKDRNELYKHLVHGANFMQGPKGAAEKVFKETGIEYPVSKVGKVMDIYFELFPGIRKWHKDLMLQAHDEGFLRNPFGYVHRFYKVYDYKKIPGKRQWEKEPGPDANKVIAFLPQSTAAGIIKEAILRLYFSRFDDAGQYLRLQVHDEIFFEAPESIYDKLDAIVKEEMERPIPELRLPASYNMGPYLQILTEEKKGYRWGSMR